MILQVFSLNPPLQGFPLGGGGFCLEGAGFAWRFLMILQVFSLNPPLQGFPLGGGGFCVEIFDDFTSFLA